MVKFYIRKIREGKLTIEEVPLKWRAQVKAELKSGK